VISPLLLLGLLATSAQPAAAGELLRLEADRVVVDERMASGEGAVRAWLLDGELQAERFEILLDGGGAVLEEGSWSRPGATLQFQRLELLPDGRVRLDGAAFTSCGCSEGRPPWQLQAWRVVVRPDERAVVIGGLVRLAGCPLVPVPAALLPLRERQTGLLPPELGYGQDGLELGLPLYLVLGPSADLSLIPRWRQQRGLRLGSELRWALPHDGGGELEVEGGYDALEGALRGAVDWRHGHADGGFRTAGQGRLVSDHEYLADFEPDFASRQQSFHEARALVGYRGVRLEHDSFQDPAGAEQRLLGVVLARPARDAGALSPWVQLDLGLGGSGPQLDELDQRWMVSRSGMGLDLGGGLGALQAQARLAGRALLVESLDGSGAQEPAPAQAQLSAEGELTLPMWADHGAARHLLRPSLRAGSALTQGEPLSTLHPSLSPLPAWWVGPALQSRWLTHGAMPFQLDASLPISDQGLLPRAEAWLGQGPWWGSLLAGGDWQQDQGFGEGLLRAAVGLRGDPGSLSLGALRLQEEAASGQLQVGASWALPLGQDRWVPRASARWSPEDAVFVERHLGLAFSSRCDCLGVSLGATWAEDRSWPDLGLQLSAGR